MKNLINLILFAILSSQLIAQDYINFYPWTSGTTTGTMTSDPDIGEFGTKSGCITATTTVVNSGGIFQTSNPQFTSTYGTTLGLRVGINWTNTSQTTTITIDLKNTGNLIDLPVSFNIYDINAAACGTGASPILAINKFIDVVNVKGYKRTNNTTVNTGTIYNPNTMTNVGSGNTLSSYTITGSSSGGGNISSAVNFTTAICRIVITYTSGTGTPPGCTSFAPWPLAGGEDPRAQEIAISPLQINYNCALPVEFGEFNYVCNSNNIDFNWNTYSELNNDYFQIHSSIDGINYELVNETDGSGTLQSPSSYNASLEKRNNLTTYYRLKQIDFNGVQKELSIISIPKNCFDDSEQFWINPNPFNNEIKIQWSDNISNNNQITVFDLAGKIVYQDKFSINYNNLIIDTKDWDNGIYLFQIINNEKITTQKLLKN